MADRPRILIVDDEPSIRAALQLAFEGTEWQIESVGTAESALERLRASTFDLFLVDKNLPGMNGVELARQIRQRGDDSGIILITGYASTYSAAEALNIGIDAYLEKPFENIYDVVRTVRETLAKRARTRRPPAASAPSDGATLPPLRILVASASRRNWLQVKAHLASAGDAVSFAGPIEEVLAALGREESDLLILDSSSYTAEVTELVAQIRARSRLIACVVMGERLTLPVIKRLIELDVRSFIDSPPDSGGYRAKIDDALDRTRNRKLLRELLQT